MSALTLGPAVMFTPADRPERYATALERADAVILDLEDAVTPDARPAARNAVAAAWAGRVTGGVDGGPLDEDRVAFFARDGIRKTMKYDLAASPFVLQVSGSKENALSIAIQPSSE